MLHSHIKTHRYKLTSKFVFVDFLLRKAKKKRGKGSVWDRCSFPRVASDCVKQVEPKRVSHPEREGTDVDGALGSAVNSRQ